MPSITEVILQSIIMHTLLTVQKLHKTKAYTYTISKTMFKLNSCMTITCDRRGFTISILSY